LLPFNPEPTVFSSTVKNIKMRTQKTITLPVFLYGCETWSQILREEQRLRVFVKRDEVMGGWRKWHKEMCDFYFLPNIIRIMKLRRMWWVGHVGRMGEKRNPCRVLVGEPEATRPLGRPRHEWVDNIKMDGLR
jgi:hypothetical protein